MRTTFRQGIVSHESPNPLELSGSNVNIIASNRPLTVTIAHRTTDYIHSENSSVASAWTGVTGADYWLYWDFDLLTFARTFGKTNIEPVYQATAPSSPAAGQMWYDTANNVHYEYSAGTWIEVLRVFAAKFISSALSGVAATGSSAWAGTQIGNTNSALAGRVLFDEASDTIIRDDRTLFTTEDQFFTAQSRVDALRLESNVSRALSLDSLIAAFTVVAWKDDGKVSAATYNDVGSTVVGMLTEQIQHAGAGSPVLTASETGAVIIQGTVTNPAWTWTTGVGAVDVGSPLWVNNGVLVTVDPHLSDPITYSVGQVPVARVLSIDTVIFEQGLGGKGDKGSIGPAGTAVAATTSSLGSVVLVSDSSTPSAPQVISDLDPRLTDARIPSAPHADNVLVAGDTMTGLLILSADPAVDLGAATKQYVDNATPSLVLNELTDVIVAGSPLVTDQVLTFNGTNWVNADAAGGGAFSLNDLTDVVVAGSPAIIGKVLTFDGANWSPESGAGNWVTANNGTNFTIPPIATGLNAIAIGNNANTGYKDTITIGSNASAINFGIAIGLDSIANSSGCIAIGKDAQAPGGSSLSIGYNSQAQSSFDVCIGRFNSTVSGGGGSSIAIGNNSDTSDRQSIAMGYNNNTALQFQVAIGNRLNAIDVTSDVDYSVKLGNGPLTANTNFLHLFSKGKLELYGDEAQYVLPSYGSPGILPGETGGLIYDSIAQELKVYDGATWNAVSTPPEEPAAVYGTTGAQSIDLTTDTFFYPSGTTTGVITFTFDNPASTGTVTSFTIKLIGAGDNAPVWPAGVDWPAATEPTWTAGGTDFVSFITHDGGTTWYGMLGGLAFA